MNESSFLGRRSGFCSISFETSFSADFKFNLSGFFFGLEHPLVTSKLTKESSFVVTRPFFGRSDNMGEEGSWTSSMGILRGGDFFSVWSIRSSLLVSFWMLRLLSQQRKNFEKIKNVMLYVLNDFHVLVRIETPIF